MIESIIKFKINLCRLFIINNSCHAFTEDQVLQACHSNILDEICSPTWSSKLGSLNKLDNFSYLV